MMSSSQCSSITSGNMLSEDLIYEILLRLPVKSLVGFKAVSKSWCSLITSPSFVKSHLSVTRPGDDETLIVVKDHDDVSFSLLHLGSCKIVADLKSPFSQGELPTWKPYVVIVGSVRGIVCVSTYRSDNYDFDVTKYTYLWNPATKESKLIPPPTTLPNFIKSNDDKPFYYVPSGFGFDPISNDFKVVSQYCDEVYSTNMNDWRPISSDSVGYSFRSGVGVCVNRFLCWMTSSGGIMALDLNKEVFSLPIELPNGFKDGTIADFNNSIVVIIHENLLLGKFGLWMLDDVECLRRGGGGVEASWTLMLNIKAGIDHMSIDDNHHYFNRGVENVHPYFNRGNLLLAHDGIVFLHNTDKKKYKKLKNNYEKLPVSSCWGHIFKYEESLVSIPGFKQVECSRKQWEMDRNL